MHTCPLPHCEPEVHVLPLQQGCTQRFLPETVLMQKHIFLVFLHRLSQLLMGGPLRGHVGAASASLVAAPSPAAPSALAAANCSALRREIVLLARAVVRLSKSWVDTTSAPPPLVTYLPNSQRVSVNVTHSAWCTCAISMRGLPDLPKLRRPAGRSVSMQPAVT
jgi:hypothetical protein